MKFERNPGKAREREFSCLRNHKSRRSVMSKSNIIYSHAHNQQADLSKSFIRQLDSQYDYGVSQQAQKKQRTESAMTRKNQQLRKSKILCADCFNKEIKSSKGTKHKGQKDRQIDHPQSLINQNDEYHKDLKSRNHDQYQKMNQYNLSIIKQHQKDKREQNEARKKEIEEAGKKYQQNKAKEALNFEELVKKRQLFRQQLQKQIESRKSRNKTITDQNNLNDDGLFKANQRNSDMRQKKETAYRNALKEQINENRQRSQLKRINEQKLKKEVRLETVKYVADQQKEKREKEKKRQALKEEADMFIKQKNERKLQRCNKEKQFEQAIRLKQAEIQQKQSKKRQKQHKTKLDKYLGELKEQMKLQRAKKQQEHRELYNAPNISLLSPQKKNNTIQCQCCEHQYPKNYLTRYHPEKFSIGA